MSPLGDSAGFNSPLRQECSDWPADLLITEEYLTEESPGGVQRTYRITPDLLDDLLALYASLETQEQLHGPTSELTISALNGDGAENRSGSGTDNQ